MKNIQLLPNASAPLFSVTGIAGNNEFQVYLKPINMTRAIIWGLSAAFGFAFLGVRGDPPASEQKVLREFQRRYYFTDWGTNPFNYYCDSTTLSDTEWENNVPWDYEVPPDQQGPWPDETDFTTYSTNPCRFYGVTCDDADEHVVKLDLRCVNPGKPLACFPMTPGDCTGFESFHDISGLSHLQSLYLGFTEESVHTRYSQTGFPRGFEKLTQLQELVSLNIMFKDNLPNISECTALENVELPMAWLDGQTPPLGKLTRLTNLNVRMNSVMGTLPSLDALSNLIHLDFSQ